MEQNGKSGRQSDVSGGLQPRPIPEHGWKVKLNHTYAEKRNQNITPRLGQLHHFVALGLRYLPYYVKSRLQGHKPTIDGIKTLGLQQIYGVPLGGIGGGTIGRGFKGEFCRFQLFPGCYQHYVVKQDTFIVSVRKNGSVVYQQVLSPSKPKKTLSAWKWGFPGEDAEYTGLYPCSWTVYHLKEVNIDLVCHQVSPVIPHDYKESSLPVGVFVWDVINHSDEEMEVSIAFTFKNGTGSRKDGLGGRWNEHFSFSDGEHTAHGVAMHQTIKNADCTVGISALAKDDVHVSHLTSFDAKGTGLELWNNLLDEGAFKGEEDKGRVTVKGEEIGCAIAAKVKVAANHFRQIEMCLVMDMPKFSFKAVPDVYYTRRYTRWFGADGKAVAKLSLHGLTNYRDWLQHIGSWQKPILENSSYPDWYKSALFNELYFISDGGTLWIENTDKLGPEYENDPRTEYGKFAYLEGHEYRMYNTYDVHFYASYALVMLWPHLQVSLQYDMADYVVSEDLQQIYYLLSGDVGPRKTANCVPHDIGDPEEAPFELINGYNVQDTATWKDLNLKFVLQVYRDYFYLKDDSYLRNMWPVVKILIDKSMAWDKDGDGIIENSGTPDQTFDTWIMTGPSAYCGGLWLASLFVAIQMAKILGFTEEAKKYDEVLEKGKKSFQDILWTGKYYRFDASSSNWSDSVMADQLCGHWYLRMCGFNYEVFPKENVQQALRTVYELNVKGFKEGRMGAVNSMKPNGQLDRCTIQAEEVWTGVTYGIAAMMIKEGLMTEAMHTAEGMYRSVFEELGMAYQTPEALHPEKHYRSLGYMRPLSIWAMQSAMEKTTDRSHSVD